MPARLVVLASGEGTTLQGILDAAQDPAYGAEVVAVGTDREPCRALDRAVVAGVPTFVVRLGDYAQRTDFDDAVAKQIAAFEPDLVVLAGYMKILGPSVVARFRTVNTHPALLPRYPGAHAVRDALADGATVTGATVHWVDEGVDTGPVIAQVEVAVLSGDDEDALHARIKAVEGPLFVDTVGRLARHEL
ncbi:MAG TPA: phosphoribosylglycinamide formyltransferase [Mycobacteriales bacterium]|nr:phosphoribosylglycinamide formyltransferase [Mycobacteriales bacterium]